MNGKQSWINWNCVSLIWMIGTFTPIVNFMKYSSQKKLLVDERLISIYTNFN